MARPKSKIPTVIAVDTGGTFTDFYALGPSGLATYKVLSTPHDPSQALIRGLKEMGIKKNFLLIHGSTVATNALLEHKGARVALVTTAGFEDVLEIGRQNRSSLYDLRVHRPAPLVSRPNRLGIGERISVQGRILEPLDRPSIPFLKKRLAALKPESLAICLLAAFANPRHEKILSRALQKLKIPISLSSEICPEFREFERTSTTVINAYVAPLMARYLGRLAERIPGPIRVMQSNGGALSTREASRDAVRTLLSGPAGGALGALRAGSLAGYQKLITLDMGGTSTDMTLIDQNLELTTEATVAGYPIKTPMLRIDTIGAGGGSLAWVDAGGALRVGPQSAGADPGPIAYGRGGRQVTLTDAHLYLGRLAPEFFLGGKMRLKPERISSPMKKLASRLRLSPERVAEGIVQVANANMAAALRVLTLERGHDPREFNLLVFGGAGGLHGCELAEQLSIPRVLVPRDPGLLSAMGMAHADWVRDYVKTVLLRSPGWREIQCGMRELRRQAIRDARREGWVARQIVWREEVDVRYRGQSYELTVGLSKNFSKGFRQAHLRQYGYLHPGVPLEVVNLRLQARVKNNFPDAVNRRGRRQKKQAVPRSELEMVWAGRPQRGKIFRREDLVCGEWLSGPALVGEFSATTFVPPGWRLEVDGVGNLVLLGTPKSL